MPKRQTTLSITAREQPRWIHTAIQDAYLTVFQNEDLFASVEDLWLHETPTSALFLATLIGSIVSFREFIDLYKVRSSALEPVLWNHIEPVSKACEYEDVGYTSFLRIGEQSLWIDALLHAYNLTETVKAILTSR